MNREAIFNALFSLVSPGEGQGGKIVGQAGETLAFTSRRMRLFPDLPAVPALCQAEYGETFVQQTGLPHRRSLSAAWMVYHRAGEDPSAVPSTTTNNLLDALEAAIRPQVGDPGYLAQRQTLGGLIHHGYIDGKVIRVPGDLDGEALVVIPITLLIP